MARRGDEQTRHETETLGEGTLEEALPAGEPTATLGASAAVRGRSDAGAEAEPETVFEPGTRLGRYLLLESVGSGGMGRVYAAYDPKLDRRVALKVLRQRVQAVGDGEARLLREARALARLNHPNVLSVFDADEVDGTVFLATEFVAGRTFTQWLEETRPPRRRVLQVLLEAGRGLEAAHAADLVHRDFKGGNVMVADDGRVLVLDFGLARSGLTAAGTSEAGPSEAGPSGDDPSSPPASSALSGSGALEELTRLGVRLGTPAYMAPEQRRGEAVGPAADQYSFCVVAVQALTGVLPARDVDGRVPSSLPRRLRRPLERGLAERPEQRHEDLGRLLDRLERAVVLPRRLALALLVLVVALAFGFASRQQGPSAEQLCATGAGRWTEVVGPERLARLERAAGGDASPLDSALESTLAPAVRRLGAYGERWRGMYRQACEASHRLGQESRELLDLRLDCLDRRLGEVDAALDVLESSGRYDRAGRLVAGLTRVAACGDTRALRSPLPPPRDEQARRHRGRLLRRLAAVKALWLVGDFSAGLEASRRLVERAQDFGHWPLIAEARLEEARLLESLDRAEEADAALVETLLAAGAGSHLRIAAEASVRRVRVLGYQLRRREAMASAVARAEALIGQLSEPSALRAELDELLGVLAARDGRHGEARRRLESSLDAKEVAHGPQDLSLAATLARLAETARAESRLDEAAELLERALAINRRHLGDEHANIAGVLAQAGAVALEAGRAERALEHHGQALEIRRRVYGERHVKTAMSLADRAGALTWLGRFDEAAEDFAAALEIFEERFDPGHPFVAIVLSNLASARIRQGRSEEAVELFARALAIQREAYGAEHPQVAGLLFNLGEALRRSGRPRDAMVHLEAAAAIWERQGDAGRDRLADAATALGEAWLELDRAEEAIVHLESALATRSEGRRPDLWAKNAFALARALDALGRERQRALELAGAARARYLAAGASHAAELEAVEAWLAARGRSPDGSPDG